MNKNHDLMSPEASPNQLKKSGVRRVNNLPLILALSVFMVFVLIIALVAMQRANRQSRASAPAPLVHHSDSSMMAAEIVAGHIGGLIESSKSVGTVSELAFPVALVENPDKPPILHNKPPILRPKLLKPEGFTEADLDRIKMAKIQQFEDAVKAKMNIPFPNQQTNSISTQNQGMSLNEKISALKRKIVSENSEALSLLPLLDAPIQNDRFSLHSQVEAPATPFVLRAGSVIPGTMISGIEPALPGQITGQVAQDVYDTATGKHLLIPQGTKLLGIYSNEVVYGQKAVLTAWQRLTFPDGKVLDIGSMPGGDSGGYAGFHDQVNNHYGRVFGSAFLMSGVVAGLTYSQNHNQPSPFGTAPPTAGSVMSAALGQELGQVTTQMIDKNLNVAPMLAIRPGYPFNIIVVKDMTFIKPYQSFDY